MRFFTLLILTALLVISCNKNDCGLASGSLDGSWKMVLVKDIATGAEISKPASLQGDVVIHFVTGSNSTGSFTGNTPTNVLGPDNYTVGSNNTLSIQSLTMTKVMETPWGAQFVDNIREAQNYDRSLDGKLIINTRNKRLSFIKL